MLTKLSLPVDEPVTLELCKKHLRIDHSDEDALIELYRDSAVAYIEHYTTRALATAEYQQTYDEWPDAAGLTLCIAPVREVTEVAYIDEAGDEQTVADENWYLTKTPEGGTVSFVSDYSQPTLNERPGSLIVRFNAGYDVPDTSAYGADPELVLPSPARSCALLLTAHAYANREPVNIGNIVNELPFAVQWILNQLRIYR